MDIKIIFSIVALVFLCVILWKSYKELQKENYDLIYDSMGGHPQMLKLPSVKYALKITDKTWEHGLGFVIIGDFLMSWGQTHYPFALFNKNFWLPLKNEPYGLLACPGVSELHQHINRGVDGKIRTNPSRNDNDPRTRTISVQNLNKWGFLATNITTRELPLVYLTWGEADHNNYYPYNVPKELRKKAKEEEEYIKNYIINNHKDFAIEVDLKEAPEGHFTQLPQLMRMRRPQQQQQSVSI